jgi:hypothetical protein
MTESKWNRVNQLTTRPKETALTPTSTSGSPIASVETEIAKIKEQRLGIIGGFKRNQ